MITSLFYSMLTSLVLGFFFFFEVAKRVVYYLIACMINF